MAVRKMGWMVALLTVAMGMPAVVAAETCTTQSQMTATDRDGLSSAAHGLAAMVQAGDVSGLRAATVAEYAKDFGGIGDVVGGVAPKIKDGTLIVEQVYLLDGSTLKRSADGSLPGFDMWNRNATNAQ